MRKYLIIVALVGSIHAWAQDFSVEVPIASVQADGFYRVPLSPEVALYSNVDFSNFRIVDQKGKQVPYLFRVEPPTYEQQLFKAYTIVEKKQEKGLTTIILENAEQRAINNISLLIGNAAVTKEAVLSGSDDRQQWYALKERFSFNPVDNHNGTAAVNVLNFPMSSYRYYLLQIADSLSAPLNIINAGYYDVLVEAGAYTAVPVRKTDASENVKAKKTHISIQFDTTRILDKIELNMTGAPYFLRSAEVYQKLTRKDAKGQIEDYFERVASATIQSGKSTRIELPGISTNEIRIDIDNDDNLALSISTAQVFQLNRYLVTWLQKDTEYYLKFTRSALPQPGYDIGYFKESIPDQSPLVQVKSARVIKETPVAPVKQYFTNRMIVWVAIVAVIAVLGFMSIRMIKDASKKA